jgi:hypothetical protein
MPFCSGNRCSQEVLTEYTEVLLRNVVNYEPSTECTFKKVNRDDQFYGYWGSQDYARLRNAEIPFWQSTVMRAITFTSTPDSSASRRAKPSI